MSDLLYDISVLMFFFICLYELSGLRELIFNWLDKKITKLRQNLDKRTHFKEN
jgi:hypothetical protein